MNEVKNTFFKKRDKIYEIMKFLKMPVEKFFYEL